MITYKEAKKRHAFCQCEECVNTYCEEDETGFWEVCQRCTLPVEGSFVHTGGDYLQGVMLSDE